MATTNISIRMDSELKAQAEALFSELGMNLSTAFNVFVRQSLRDGGIPFEIKMDQPNKETMAAMLEAERIAKDPNVKHYSDVEEALRELKRRTAISSGRTNSRRTTNLLKNGISTLIFWIISSAPYHVGNRSQRKTETTL